MTTEETASRRRTDNDAGAVLPTVLAFITVIGVIVGALLGQASVNFRATVELRENRDRNLAADAGLERAFVAADPACDESLSVNDATVTILCSGDADEFLVTSTATKDGTASVATAVIAKVTTSTSSFYVAREWRTASS